MASKRLDKIVVMCQFKCELGSYIKCTEKYMSKQNDSCQKEREVLNDNL